MGYVKQRDEHYSNFFMNSVRGFFEIGQVMICRACDVNNIELPYGMD